MESQPNPQGDIINQHGKFGVGTNQGELNQFNSNNYGGKTNNIGTQINNNYQQIQEKPKQPPNNYPGNLAKNFIGREKELAKLDENIQTASQVAISAVAGMGGVGKSELAKQYISKHQKTYPGGICWLNATEDNFISQLINLSGVEVNEKLTLVNQVQECYKNWQWQGNVLLVFDDVQNYKHIKLYLPTQPRFKVLITTRKRLGKPVVRLDLDVLSPSAALDLLASFLDEDRIVEERETAEELCAWLGYLPLGLELVGRYLEEDEDLSCQEVLDNLKENSVNDEALVETAEEMSAELGIVAAIDLSWQQLKPQAQQLAYILSLFALAPIPWELVENCCLDTNQITKPKSARKELTKLNLLKRVEKETYLFHSLIREFLHTKESQFDASQLKQVVCKVMVAKGKEIPQDITVDQVSRLSPFIPHLQEVATNLANYLTDEYLIQPFASLGRFYYGQGLYNLAEPWLLQSKNIALTRLGKNHADTPAVINNLAELYLSQGRYEEAEPLYLQAIEIDEITLHDNHPKRAFYLNNLARLYSTQGRYEEAEPLYLQAIEIAKIVFPKNFIFITALINNLAELYRKQGIYGEAETLYKKVIETSKKRLFDDNLRLAVSYNNLALLYKEQGKYKDAEFLFKKVIDIEKQALSENHPKLAKTFNNLAYLYDSQGRYQEAEFLFKKVIEINYSALSENHPEFAINFNNLASIYQSQGKYKEAEDLLIKAIKIDKTALGDNHPSLATDYNNLANLYLEKEIYEKAEALLLKAILINENKLHSNHPEIARNFTNLANVYFSQRRYEEAEITYLKAIEIDKMSLPENNPDLACKLNSLAMLYSTQGRYEQAEPFYLQALSIVVNSLGENHPNTQTVWGNFNDFIEQVVKEGREKELSNHPMVQNLVEEIKNN